MQFWHLWKTKLFLLSFCSLLLVGGLPRTLHEGLAQNRLWGPLCGSARGASWRSLETEPDRLWGAAWLPSKDIRDQREHLNKLTTLPPLECEPDLPLVYLATWEPWELGPDFRVSANDFIGCYLLFLVMRGASKWSQCFKVPKFSLGKLPLVLCPNVSPLCVWDPSLYPVVSLCWWVLWTCWVLQVGLS